MGMFGPKMGTWVVNSVEDSRWNKSGRAYGFVTEGGPDEMKEWIEECKKKFGNVPADVTYEFWKD